MASDRGVSLPEIPGTGDELEDYVAALFQASGRFVEKQMVESDPADLLELDIFVTDYAPAEIVERLVEVKGGGWGDTDLFKVVGWMNYLELKPGAFFVTKWDDRESAPKRMGPLGLDVVWRDLRGRGPQRTHPSAARMRQRHRAVVTDLLSNAASRWQ